MRAELVAILRCPDHPGQALALGPAPTVREGEIDDGSLTCGSCGALFPIRSGIPVLLPRELRGEAAGKPEQGAAQMRREMELRDEESVVYDALYDDRAYRFELETYVRQLALQPGERVLDVGCGTGRVTKEYLGMAELVVGADFSFASLDTMRRRLPPRDRERLLAICCAVGRLPLPDRFFDAVVSTSLFSNVPTAETRSAGLAEVDRVLDGGGRFLVTVYNHSWLKRLRQSLGLSRSGLKEGVHSGGRVHYYNFDPRELVEWVGPRFVPGRVFGLNHRVPLLSRSSPRVAAALDRLLYATPFSLQIFAKEMGLVARKRPAFRSGKEPVESQSTEATEN